MFIVPSRSIFALRREGHVRLFPRVPQLDMAILKEGALPSTPVSIASMSINITLLIERIPSTSIGGITTIHERNL